jgi:hypothetical protein
MVGSLFVLVILIQKNHLKKYTANPDIVLLKQFILSDA